VLVDSNQVADRLGARHDQMNTMIGANLKFLNEFGVLQPICETSGAKGGRPGKHYMLNQGQIAPACSRRAQRDALLVRLARANCLVFGLAA
jgi:hypothetical protein